MTVDDPRVTDPPLNTLADVEAWFRALHEAGVNFHPEDSFQQVVNRDSGEPTWPQFVALQMDVAMHQQVPALCRAAGTEACAVALKVVTP